MGERRNMLRHHKTHFVWILILCMGWINSEAFAFQEMFTDPALQVPSESASVDSHLRQLQQEKNGLKALQKQLLLAEGGRAATPVIGAIAAVNSIVREIERRLQEKGLRGIVTELQLDSKNKLLKYESSRYRNEIRALKTERNISAVAAAGSAVTFWAVDQKWIPYIQQHIQQRIHTIEELERDLVESQILKE
jgi:hypothetical protein